MASAIKLYLDEHVDLDVAKGLRRQEVDVLTTQEAGKVHANDDVQLAFATSEGRAIFTQDTDFLRMASTTTTHLGIIFAPQGTQIEIIISDLCLIVEAGDQEELIPRPPWFLPL